MRNKPAAIPYLWGLFIFWPFGAFILALRKIRIKRYQGLILLFSFLFGYSVYLYSGDIVRYGESFLVITNYTWSDYWFLVSHTLSPDKFINYSPNVVNTQPDIYALSLQFIVSRFTENPRWFWAIVSVVYTGFFLMFINEVSKEVKWVNSRVQTVFFVFLLMIVPFYVGVTGVRFWTALFLFMTFTIRYVRTGEVKNILILSISVLIHFSFVIPVVLLILYRFIKLSKLFSTSLIIASIFIFFYLPESEFLNTIQNNMGVLDETTIKERIEGYTDEENIGARRDLISATNWYVTARANAIVYFFLLIFILEYFNFFNWRYNSFLHKLNPLLLVFFCVTLISFNLPSIARFQYVFFLLLLIHLTVIAGSNLRSKKLTIIAYIMLPILLLHTVVILRAGFYTVDPFLIIGNPLSLFFEHSDVSLSEFIIGH